MTHLKCEEIFDQSIANVIPRLSDMGSYDLVIGIPFYEEKEQFLALVESIDQVLTSWIGKRQLLLMVGDPAAQDFLESIAGLNLKHPHLEFILPRDCSGRGASLRAIIEISKRLEADLLLFSANMITAVGPGIQGDWLESLLNPIQGPYDLVVGSLRRHLGIDSIAHMLAAPVMEIFYGFRMGDPLGGIYAIAHDLVEDLAHEAMFWGDSIRGYGIDFWLITRALCWNKAVCEVSLDGNVTPASLQKLNRVFRDTAQIVFECINRDTAIWVQERLVVKIADIRAHSDVKHFDPGYDAVDELLESFHEGLRLHYDLMSRLLSYDLVQQITGLNEESFNLDNCLWVNVLTELSINYNFDEANRVQVLDLLTALYNGRVASYVLQMQQFQALLPNMEAGEKDALMVAKMDSIRRHLTTELCLRKPEFTRRWLNKKEQHKPAIVPLGYMEYVPGKPVVIPKKIPGKDHRIVQTDNIFRNLRKSYEDSFAEFIGAGLGLPVKGPAAELIAGVEHFMQQLEQAVDEVMPGDLNTAKGLAEFITNVFNLVDSKPMFTVHADKIREMLVRFPPINLMIPLGYYKPEQLIEKMDPRDAVTYANLIEDRSYTDRDLNWLAETLKPENFEWVPLKHLIMPEQIQLGILSRGKISNANHITARISVRALQPGTGGKYPKLRYLTSILRRLAVAEHYSELFWQNVGERKNIGVKLRNSLLGLHKGDDFSAHNIFENHHHRSLVEKVGALATRLQEAGQVDCARLFRLMADGYGLSQVLEEGTFLTCTAWSWASYSFKGGLKIPGTWTTTVESRWFNHDFLESLYLELGYDPDNIMQIVYRMIQAGKSNQNLLDTLLPARPKDVTVVVQETTNQPSKNMVRHPANPLLEPIEEHPWEAKYVLNPGALRSGDKVYLFYRAVGHDGISHIGLAITDGYKVLERLPEPIFSPSTPEERMGCEDPRLVVVEDRIIMLYTAYDGNLAQIAAASISLDDFLAGHYQAWKRDGLAFKNIWDKDAILFPERIGGKYIIYHRIEPSIWVTYMNEIKFPLKEKHAIILGPRPGRMWDSLKIGAGAQPLKTRHGWLLIYHGVDYNYVYSLGVFLVDLHNPQKVLYRSPNPILQPEEDYEIGLSGAWVPNVVFTCGAVSNSDKDVLEDDDLVMVYYGAADTSIGVATATVADLIPEEYRRR
ncbi:MAG: glycosidase [Syntrophomonadaceae bacterium]